MIDYSVTSKVPFWEASVGGDQGRLLNDDYHYDALFNRKSGAAVVTSSYLTNNGHHPQQS